MKQIAVAGALVIVVGGALAVGSLTRGDGEPGTARGRIAFLQDGSLVVANADGSAPRTLVVPPPDDVQTFGGLVWWTPTGRIVFWKSAPFTSVTRGTGSFRSIAPDGGGERAADLDNAAVSPDGSLEVSRHPPPGYPRAFPSELWLKDRRSGASARRLTHEGTVYDFAWAPNSRTLVYTRMVGDYLHPVLTLWTVEVDGTGLRQLTKGPLDTMPVWSPDGSQIAFISGRDRNGENCNDDRCDPNGELYLMRADGRDVRRLTHTRAQESFPAWRPDGRRIAFIRRGSDLRDTELHATDTEGTCERLLARDAHLVEAFGYSLDASGPACPAAT